MKNTASSARLTATAMLTAVLLTAAVLGSTCAVFGLYPFGTGSLCWCDMRQQGLPLLMMLRHALLNGDSLAYLPSLTGGADFSGVAAFFLMNPGSLLSVFWRADQMLDLLNLLVFAKLLLCALTAAWFFARRFPQNGAGFAAAFALGYALCGYGLLYYQNLMWLDVMALFPLFLLACYALLERGRALAYIGLLALIMTACFYIGFMVALFALLFFGVHLCLVRKHRARTAVRFLLGSGAAAALSAPVWLPAFFAVLDSARGSSLSASLTSCGWSTPFATSLPLLLCSAGLPLLLIVTALFFPRWNKKSAAIACLCALLLLPMFCEPINRMWHMGSYMCFPCRFAFMPIFLLQVLVAQLWACSPVTVTKRRPLRVLCTGLCGLSVLGIAAFLKLTFSLYEEPAARYLRTLWGDFDSLRVHLSAFAAVAMSATLFCIFWRAGFLKKRVAAVLLCGLILCESAFYSALYIGKVPDYWRFSDFKAVTDLADRWEDSSFARVKTESDLLDSNMIGALGYPSLGGYTSLVPEGTLFSAKRLGYTANWMDIGTNGGTEFSDMLLSVGGSIDRTVTPAPQGGTVYENEFLRLQKTPYFLPLGLVVSESASHAVKTLPKARIATQEALAASLFSQPSLVCRYEPSETVDCTLTKAGHGAAYSIIGAAPVITYRATVHGAQTLYFDCFDRYSTRVSEPIFQSFSVAVNGQTVCPNYPNAQESGFLKLGVFENESVTVTLTPLKSGAVASFGVFGLRHAALSVIEQTAPTAALTYNGRAYVGSVTAAADRRLLVTIPHLRGLHATVNGRRVPLETTMDSFVSLPLENGENTVVLRYTPPGRTVGLLLCAAGLLLTALAVIFRTRLARARASRPRLALVGRTVAVTLAFTASGLCVATVYLFPVLFKLFNS